MFGPVLPSHGFFIRHARNIHLNNVEVVCIKEDARPAFVVQDVRGADFFRVKAQRPPDASTFALKNVADFSLTQSRPLPDTVLENVVERSSD